MSASGTPLIIPIQFDTAGMERAIAEAQQRVVDSFNKAQKAAGGSKASSFGQVQSSLNQLNPSQQQQLTQNQPGLAKSIDIWNQFAQSGQDAIKVQAQLSEAHRQFTSNVKQLSSAFSIAQQSVMFAFGRGSPGSLFTLVQQLGGAAITKGWLPGSPSLPQAAQAVQTSAAATQVVTQAAQSAASSGVKAALASGAGRAAGAAAAQGAGAGLPAVPVTPGAGAAGASGLVGALTNPVGIVATVVAALAGIGLAVNEKTSEQSQQQHELTANTGLGGGTAYGQTLGTAGGYILDTGQTRALYNQLGRAGVSSGQVRGVANDSAAFSRISGMDPQTVAQLAETQSVQGNMSDKDIAKFFDAIVVGAKTVGVSMNRLYDTFSAFGVATGNLALTLHGQLSLMGAQQAYGKSINAGSVGAGLETAQGTDVMKFASILGISQDQFMQYQANDPAKLQGLTLQFLNKQTQGLKGAQRLSTMEAIDQGIGDPLGLSGLNAKQAQTLLNTDPNKLINAAANIGKKVQPSGTDLTKTGQAYGGSDTGVVAKAFKQMETTSDGWLQKIATNTSDLISAVENVPKDLVNLLTNVVTNPSQGIPDALQQLLPGSGILNALVDPMMAPLDAGIGLLHSFGVGGGGGGGSADMPFGGAGSLYGNANPTTQYGWGWNGKTAAPGNQSGGGAPSSGGNPSRGGVRNGRTYKVSNTRGGIDTVSGALSDAYQFAAQQYGLNINDLLAIGARESDFNVNAHAPDGGQGIMQLQPDTVTQLLSGKGLKNDPFAGRQLTNKTQYDHDKYFNPYDMGDNVSAGAYWYAQKLAAAGGNEQLGLTGYNGYANGPGVVTSYGQQVSAAAQTVIMIQDATSGGVAVTARVNGKPVPIQKRGPRGGRGYGAQAQ